TSSSSATASTTPRTTATSPTWASSHARSTRTDPVADSAKNSSGRKRRPFSGLALWIIVALLLGMAMFSLFGRAGYQQLDTQQGLELLAGDTVEQVKITGGNQQRVDLVLTEEFVDGEESKGTEVRFAYVDARAEAVVQAVEENAPAKGYTDEIATSSWWSTLL